VAVPRTAQAPEVAQKQQDRDETGEQQRVQHALVDDLRREAWAAVQITGEMLQSLSAVLAS
jgi:hypothetical protein